MFKFLPFAFHLSYLGSLSCNQGIKTISLYNLYQMIFQRIIYERERFSFSIKIKISIICPFAGWMNYFLYVFAEIFFFCRTGTDVACGRFLSEFPDAI